MANITKFPIIIDDVMTGKEVEMVCKYYGKIIRIYRLPSFPGPPGSFIPIYRDFVLENQGDLASLPFLIAGVVHSDEARIEINSESPLASEHSP